MNNTEIKTGTEGTKSRIIFKNLTKKQKELLSAGGIITAGLGLGTGLFSLISMGQTEKGQVEQPGDSQEAFTPVFESNQTQDNSAAPQAVSEVPAADPEGASAQNVVIYTKSPVVEGTSDGLSFSEAFRHAREEVGAGGWFRWRDDVYNTYYKEEWSGMTAAQKDQYLASLELEPASKEMLAADQTSPETTLTVDEDPDTDQTADDGKSVAENIVPGEDPVNVPQASDSLKVSETAEMHETSDAGMKIEFIPDSIQTTEENTPQDSVITFTEENYIPVDSTEVLTGEESADNNMILLDENIIEEEDGTGSYELPDSLEIIEINEDVSSLILDNAVEEPWGEIHFGSGPQASGLTSEAEVLADAGQVEAGHDFMGEPVVSPEVEQVEEVEVPSEAVAGEGVAPSVVEYQETPWGEVIVKPEVVLEPEEEVEVEPTVTHADAPVIIEYEETPWGERLVKPEPAGQGADHDLPGGMENAELHGSNVNILFDPLQDGDDLGTEFDPGIPGSH